MVRAALSRIHPHELWKSGHRLPDGKRPTQTWVAKQLGITQGHLSSIYKGEFRPSEEIAKKMAVMTNGACSTKEIMEWHRKNPPVWEQGKAIRKAMQRTARKKTGLSEPAIDPKRTLLH